MTRIQTLTAALCLTGLTACGDNVSDHMAAGAIIGGIGGAMKTDSIEGAAAGAIIGGASGYIYAARYGEQANIGFNECRQRYSRAAEIRACDEGVRSGRERAERRAVRDARRAGVQIGSQNY